MDDDEIQIIEVTVRTGSPVRKRKRKESLPRQESTETPSNNDMVYKAAQLKRRLAFCEKEQEELAKRFKAIKDQLTDEQSCQLDVKLEKSTEQEPVICVGDNSDDDVIFVLPEDYSPLKKRKLDDANKAETFDSNANQPKKDVAITYFKPATNLPHARENCAVHKFVQSNVTSSTVSCNESYCEQCYCYVCDAPVKECDSWKTGTNPHCNGYAKNAFWEKLRKMAKRKVSAVQDSLLKCLPADEQTESLQAAAAKVTELLETLRDEINNSGTSSFRPSSPCCDCDCHGYDSDDSCGGYREEGCRWCYDEHESRMYDWPFGRYGGGGFAFSLSSNVSNTVSKATDYLKNDQPGQAAVVLDALTVLLLTADNDRNRWYFGQVNAALKCLQKAWIEVLMHPDLPSNVEDKVRGRLKNAIDGALICSPENTGLKMILEMKKWNDESLVKCLAGKLGNDFITEDEEVAEARLAFLEKNKRFSDTLYYMLGCKVTQRNRNFAMPFSTGEQRLTNIANYRHKFILLLAKTGKIDQALIVITAPGEGNLDKDVLTNTTPKETGINVNYSQCALANISYSHMTELLTAIVNDGSSTEEGKLPSPQIIPEAKLRKVLALILTGAQINSSLRTETALEWYISSFCESSLTNNMAKDVRQKFIKGAEQHLDKAKNKMLAPSDITPPFIGPCFKLFVVDLLAALAVRVYATTSYYQLYSITNSMGVFKKKDLPWACVSIVLSSTITEKISPQILGFVLDNVIKPLGSSCIPFKVYESWIKKLPDMYGIEKNYEIIHFILKERKRKPATSQSTNNAVALVKKIVETIESMLNKGTSWNKEKLTAVLNKMKKDFPSGLNDLEGKIMGLSFKNDPNFTNFENVRKTCKQENWPQLRETMIDFLKKHRTSHTACCLDVFGQCFMFNEVKHTLTACGYTGSYPTICDKIKQTLSKLKKGDACQLAEVCADWLGKTLCNGAFQNWRYGYKYIPDTMLSCLKAIADVRIQTFNDILSAAIRNAANIFDNKTVQVKNRSDLERWLKDIKDLYSSKNQMRAWSWAFHEITTGRLKRKPAVIRQLKNSTGLLARTIPYHQLIKMQAPSNTATNTSGSKTTASKQAVNASTSTATNVTRAKPALCTAASKYGARATASTPTNTTTAKPAQGTPVSKQAVNMAASTSTNLSTTKPAQGTPVSKQAVNMAASTSTNLSTTKPAQGTPVSKQAANMATSTSTNLSTAKPAQGTPVSKQVVNMAASTSTNLSTTKPAQQAVRSITSTPTNTAGAKPTQGSAAKGAVNMVPSTPTNVPTAKPAQGMAVPKHVASTPRNASSASTLQGTRETPRSARAGVTPKQPANIVVSTPSNTQSAKPSGSPSATVNASGIGMQRPVGPIQPANLNKSVLVPNSIALSQQQLAEIIRSTNRLLAGNNNVVIRAPPSTSNIPATTPPVGTFVPIAPKSSTTASMARTSTAPAVVSSSSTVVNSLSSKGSPA